MNTPWLRLLRLAARRPLAALATLAIAPLLLAAGILWPRHDVDAASPRAVLGRVWFDTLPEKDTDVASMWIWLGGGVGIHDRGSRWRSTVDVFEFERQNDKLAMTFLHDKKNVTRRFTITKCDDKPPFDVCLDLDEALAGKKRYYGFSYGEDMDTKIPWGRAVLRAAEARSAGPR